jgi:hypothetical protein
MKNLSLYITFFVAAVSTLAACSSDEEPTGDFIKLADGVQTSIVYPRDSYSSDRQIIFSTNGPWDAEITEMSKSPDGEWISLWNNHGDSAGVYHVGVSVTQNVTDDNRRATIRVTSGEAQQDFYVFQRIEGGTGGVTDTYMSKDLTLSASEPTGKIFINSTKGNISITGYMTCSNPSVTQCFLQVSLTNSNNGTTYKSLTVRKQNSGVDSDVLTVTAIGEQTINVKPTEGLQPDEVIHLTVTYVGS